MGMSAAGVGAAVAVALTLLAACAHPPPGTTLPSFPPASTVAPATASTIGGGVVPADCTRVLAPPDLGAVLGLPLGTVGVRTTLGVPAPAVRRTERLDCAYTMAPGQPLLAVRAAAYADAAAARAQWQLNASSEDGSHRDVPIGGASGVLVERPGETLLSVVYGRGTLTLTLPARSLPGGRAPGDVLVDLALRALPAMAGAAPARATRRAPTAAPDAPVRAGLELPVRAAGPGS